MAYPMDEVMSKYQNEWVAAKVVEEDENGQPLKVEILAHHFNRSRLRDKLSDLDVKEKEIFIFYAGPIPLQGYTVVL